MQINYQETSKDLMTRIGVHEKYGARNIDQWTIEVLKPQPGTKILDVGCGAGKQCFLYSDTTQRKAEIIGGDFSNELLEMARTKTQSAATRSSSCSWISTNALSLATIHSTWFHRRLPSIMPPTWTLPLARRSVSSNPAGGSSSPAPCPKTSRCSMTSSKRQPTSPFRPCQAPHASKARFIKPSKANLQKQNC